MRAQQVDLQPGGVGAVDPHGGELAEARGDAVDDAALGQRLLDHGAPGGDPLAVARVERRRRGAAGDGLELGGRGHQTSPRACSMRRATVVRPLRAGPALPHPGGGGAVVVRDPAVLDAPVGVDERVGGARVAVERQPDRAGVDELDPARRRDPPERQVRVAEDQSRLRHAREQLRLVLGRLGEEGAQVAHRRGVAVAHVLVHALLRQRAELVDRGGAERLAAGADGVGDDRVHAVVELVGRRAPALAVPAQPQGGGEGPQALQRGLRLGAEEAVVAAEEPAVGALRAGVGEDGVEGGGVAVHVVEQGEHPPRV